MPYISKEDRQFINDGLWAFKNKDEKVFNITQLAEILQNIPSDKRKGSFNYFITRLWCQVFEHEGKNLENDSYTKLSNDIAVLNDIEGELRRRFLDEYEDLAIARNGDLPELSVDGEGHISIMHQKNMAMTRKKAEEIQSGIKIAQPGDLANIERKSKIIT